jgi:hypothetical protein
MPDNTAGLTVTPRHDLELLQGAIDIHVHNGPDIYPRIQDHVQLAQAAQGAGFRGICLKCHNFPTVQLAIAAKREVPDFDVFSSLVCNHHVGGVNPIAVEAAIKYGARQIFMPTVDAENHARLANHIGQHGKGLMVKGGLSKYTTEKPRIRLVDAQGNLPVEMREVIQLIADADVILNFGHTSFEEIKAVAAAAIKQGVKRMIVDHPFWAKISTAEQQALAEHGIFINYTVGELLPRWWRVSVDSFADGIRQVGVRRMIVSSDCGQLHNPLQVEGMRMVCQLLVEEGFSFEDIRQLVQHNPADMIYA